MGSHARTCSLEPTHSSVKVHTTSPSCSATLLRSTLAPPTELAHMPESIVARAALAAAGPFSACSSAA